MSTNELRNAGARMPAPDTSGERAPDVSNNEAITSRYTDTWARLASEFSWPHYPNKAVRAEIQILAERPASLEHASRRAEPFLWFITDTLAERGLPAELALVPVVESGYRSRARSPHGAAGLWQFMPATGRRFHLRQTPWYDARRDVVLSTHAALDYLEQLHDRFQGDWLLAVAAYNCGPATVQRAIEKNQSYDFWTIARDLPPETRRHVPRLLATIEIVSNPSLHGIALHPVPNVPLFAEIDLGGPLDLEFAMSIEGWSEAGFKQLNPAFKRGYTDPDGPFKILAPLALNASITAAIDAIPDDQRMPVRAHVVQAGDTLSGIAMRYSVGINTIRRHNNIRGTLIKVGTELIVHAPGGAAGTIGGYTRAAQPPNHIVQPGESLWTIGAKYGTTAEKIATLNDLPRQATLFPGQSLQVGRGRVTRYDVTPGDSLWTIGRKFRVTIGQLRRWNNLSPRKLLHPGQSLVVSKPLPDTI